MSTSTFKITKTVDDIYEEIVDYLAFGIATVEFEELTFVHGTTQYTLNNDNIIEIISIEGVNTNGYYVPPFGSFNNVTSLIENVDYNLTFSGAESFDLKDNTLNKYLNFPNSTLFENNSKIYISYKYYDSNKVSNITNFQTGSVANMLARSVATSMSNLYATNNRTYDAGFLSLAIGQDLDNHADGWGLERDSGSPATGVVRVTVSSSGTAVNILSNYSFVSYVAGQSLIFTNPTPANEGDGTSVAAGTSKDFIVTSNQNGVKYNIGANSITNLYTSPSLQTEVSNANVTVTNPILKADGSINTFTGGTDKETDIQLRTKIYNKAFKLGRSSSPALKAALEDLGFVNDVKVIDYEVNPQLDADTFYIYAAGKDGIKLLTDNASITSMRDVIDDYRPIGTLFQILSPMGIFIDFSGTITVEAKDSTNVSSIKNSVKNNITNYIQGLKVGEDVIYSQIIEEAMKVAGVYKFDIGKLNYTEFANNPFSFDNTTYKILDNQTGTPVSKWFLQDFKFLSTFRTEIVDYLGNSTFTTTYSGIANSPAPYVHLAINDGNDNYVRDPSYATNWHTSNTSTQIVIDPNAGSSVSRTLASGVDKLKLYYETHSTTTINKFRIRLGNNYSGTQSGVVRAFVYSGTNSPSTLVSSGTITVTSGVQDYEFALATGDFTVTDPVNQEYFLILSGVSTPSGTYISLPVSQSGTRGMLNTILASGASGSANYSSSNFSVIGNTTAKLHTVITTSGTSDVPSENFALTPDVAVVYEVNIDHNVITDR